MKAIFLVGFWILFSVSVDAQYYWPAGNGNIHHLRIVENTKSYRVTAGLIDNQYVEDEYEDFVTTENDSLFRAVNPNLEFSFEAPGVLFSSHPDTIKMSPILVLEFIEEDLIFVRDKISFSLKDGTDIDTVVSEITDSEYPEINCNSSRRCSFRIYGNMDTLFHSMDKLYKTGLISWVEPDITLRVMSE